jgi:predicted MPP superfamily phosphohydrolase
MFFEAKRSTAIGRFFSTVDGIWMWVSLMLFIDVLIIYLIKMFVPIPFEAICILVAIVPILGVYNYYKAHKLVVNEEIIELDNLSRDINIVHFSDVHFGSVRHKEIIHKIAVNLKELEGDCELAVLSGDLADGTSVVELDDFLELKGVGMPIIFTPGNHDFYPGIGSVIEAAKNAGMIVLDNDGIELDDLNIYGLTYSFDDIDVPSADELKSKVNPDMVNIINYHVPYKWDVFSSMGFDIQLSGHTHGGQFYPAVFLCEVLFKYNMGLFKNNLGRYLHVTTGVGSMDLPMRWGTDSELVILKLRKK